MAFPHYLSRPAAGQRAAWGPLPASPGGEGVVKGTVTLNFGAFPGSADTSVVVTGQGGVTVDSVVLAQVRPAATADHTADEHWVDPPTVVVTDIVAGVGFTVRGTATGKQRLYGQYSVAWMWG